MQEPNQISLTPLRLEDLSNLKYQIFSCSFLGRPNRRAIIVAFEGVYGYGASGNGDAYFMTAVIKAALAGWPAQGLIIDLRQMSYEWGDLIAMAFGAGQDQYIDRPFPTVIIASELNRNGLTSLVVQEMFRDPAVWLFNSLSDALRAIEAQNVE